ncbi:MAG: hypothetical protein JKY48_07105 [Flavobacteriales bacterium]|nr:hypothetical protein [Flavobacteriales bacterium]
MNYKTYVTLILLFNSSILISQVSDTSYFKDKKFLKPTTKSKAKYMAISKVGPMIQKSNYFLNPLELISSYSYKADDSLNYWRSVDVINGIKEIKTQNDSTFEIVERNSRNNDLIGVAKYKVKLSKDDIYAIQKIKNKKPLV